MEMSREIAREENGGEALVPAQPRQGGCRRLGVKIVGSLALAGAVVAGVLVELVGKSTPAPSPSPTPSPSPAPPTPTPTPTPAVALYNCSSSLDFGEVVNASQKGMAVDDTSFHFCAEKIPGLWPNSKVPMTSFRLFKAWDVNWPSDLQPKAWKALKAVVTANNASVLVGTQVTCNETEDDADWKNVLKLLQLLGRKAVMGVAVGNEMELLQFKDVKLVPRECIARVWQGGYFYKKMLERAADLDALEGFADVPLTSVFGGYIMAGNPFVETPGAMGLSFLKNVTKAFGNRWVWTLNVYPYFDPGNRLDPGSTSNCSLAMQKALCMEPTCLLPATTLAMRQRITLLTKRKDDKLWLGETGWSSPQAGSLPGANAFMAQCPEFSSEKAFSTYYSNFLKWNLSIGTSVGPEHVFYFTIRDALNFGVGEHFGLISTCESTTCKLTSKLDSAADVGQVDMVV
mmetsp:Transcript_23637/g.44640  ORF Transcript_23637/g.44640 Transcript_23637/m.44640 type:complete len:458 (+) Transcript_23637:31-1404(+)